MLPSFRTLVAILVAISGLAACDSLRGGWYGVKDIDTTIVPERLNQDQRDFFETIDVVAQQRGMRPVRCAAGVAEKKTCRSYETAKGLFLVGFLDQKANQYVISVYEWNVSNRSPLALDIEAAVLAKLRARFAERVVTLHRDGV